VELETTAPYDIQQSAPHAFTVQTCPNFQIPYMHADPRPGRHVQQMRSRKVSHPATMASPASGRVELSRSVFAPKEFGSNQVHEKPRTGGDFRTDGGSVENHQFASSKDQRPRQNPRRINFIPQGAKSALAAPRVYALSSSSYRRGNYTRKSNCPRRTIANKVRGEGVSLVSLGFRPELSKVGAGFNSLNPAHRRDKR
jgi:hypothetical protein